MKDLLFLSHRIPYPPDKGEKIRAWHMLRHLSRSHHVHVGCFIDDPDDWAHVETLRAHCADLAVFGLSRRAQQARALSRLRPGQPLTLGYFSDARLRRWVEGKLAQTMSAAFVYCSAMAPYLMHPDLMQPTHARETLRTVLDMVDVDSEKWRGYAAMTAGPMRAVWAREARTLLAFERRAAAAFDQTLLVSRAEAERFEELAPECRGRIGWIDNGVDLDHFAPAAHPDPHPPGGANIVFTGTMDYWPNVDAVTWFARDILPAIQVRAPGARFTIVGANPAASVRALADAPGVRVTGRVADVRPYLAHADVVVAPLRIARGIQNKVLEAMAMARPVVATTDAFEGIRARPGRDLLLADDAAAFANQAATVLAGGAPGLGAAARRVMQDHYAWGRVLAGLDALVDGDPPCRPAGQPEPLPAGELAR